SKATPCKVEFAADRSSQAACVRATRGHAATAEPDLILIREASQQLSIGREKRMRPVKRPNRDLMGYNMAVALTGKPGVEVEGGRLDPEGRRAPFDEIEIDRMVGCRADRGWHACKHGQCCAVDVTRCDQLHAGMTAHDRGEVPCVEEVLAIHVPDPGLERRMMQEQQRR